MIRVSREEIAGNVKGFGGAYSKALRPTHLAAALQPFAAELRLDDRQEGLLICRQEVLCHRGAARPALHAGLDEARPHNEIAVAVNDDALPRPLVHLPELAATHLHAGQTGRSWNLDV